MPKLWLRSSDSYEIDTEIYSGPLDLLLNLIQKAELDITKLAIAQVTDQFIDYVEANKNIDPDFTSEFLVIAAKLVQIKSEALLPRPPIRDEDEEDPGESLARQLIIYKQIKEAAAWLTKRAENNQRSYIHIPHHYPVNIQLDLSGIDLNQLINALKNISHDEQVFIEGSVISIPKLTLRKKVLEIIEVLKAEKSTSFSKLLGTQSSRLGTIVVFLSILELVKQDLIKTDQANNFSDILITAENKLFESADADLLLEDN